MDLQYPFRYPERADVGKAAYSTIEGSRLLLLARTLCLGRLKVRPLMNPFGCTAPSDIPGACGLSVSSGGLVVIWIGDEGLVF